MGEEGEPAEHDLRTEHAGQGSQQRDFECRSLHEGELKGIEHRDEHGCRGGRRD